MNILVIPIGPVEVLIVLAIVLFIFGAGKLTGLGAAIAKNVHDFRRAVRKRGSVEDVPALTMGPGWLCAGCGSEMAQDSKFCTACGESARVSAPDER